MRDIRFGLNLDVLEKHGYAFTYQDEYDTIYFTPLWGMLYFGISEIFDLGIEHLIHNIGNIISHETIHLAIGKLEGIKISQKFDNIAKTLSDMESDNNDIILDFSEMKRRWEDK